jgi:hypothetical protein
MSNERGLVPVGYIERRIVFLRGERVILDSELAALYGVETKVLNQAIKRNIERFPEDFMFRLTAEEAQSLRCQTGTLDDSRSLRSQIVTLKTGRGRHRKYLPYVFTEHGAIMAATVLNSERAVKASLYVVRAFVTLRRALASHTELARKLDELERRIDQHDNEISALLAAIRKLMGPPPARRRKAIGFHPRPGRKER